MNKTSAETAALLMLPTVHVAEKHINLDTTIINTGKHAKQALHIHMISYIVNKSSKK